MEKKMRVVRIAFDRQGKANLGLYRQMLILSKQGKLTIERFESLGNNLSSYNPKRYTQWNRFGTVREFERFLS